VASPTFWRFRKRELPPRDGRIETTPKTIGRRTANCPSRALGNRLTYPARTFTRGATRRQIDPLQDDPSGNWKTRRHALIQSSLASKFDEGDSGYRPLLPSQLLPAVSFITTSIVGRALPSINVRHASCRQTAKHQHVLEARLAVVADGKTSPDALKTFRTAGRTSIFCIFLSNLEPARRWRSQTHQWQSGRLSVIPGIVGRISSNASNAS